MMQEADLAHCREAIKHGSKSFYAASRLLPTDVRDAALALYAFCRLADDAVDLGREKAAAVASLRARLDRAYAGMPKDDPVERAFTAMIGAFAMPRALPEALIEGLDWDAKGLRYRTLSDVRAYSARVASAVGVMMSVLMGVRDRDALARAADLGVAMQLTNISRDIGEDAAEGRLYLPLDWFDEAGLEPDGFLANPGPWPEIAEMARRLLKEADRLYDRSEAGIKTLPPGCRPGIYAARYIYAGIGKHIAAADYDSVTRRAHTGLSEKIALMILSLGSAAADSLLPRSPILHARPLPETAFLIDAATEGQALPNQWGDGKVGALVSVFATLKERDLERRRDLGVQRLSTN
ncbi:MAG: phytoene/squalene synthase family protein [Pseudomonadota bacterium]